VHAGIERISISLDGATAAVHDRFRGVPGAYEGALSGIRNAREEGLSFQINTTVTRQNIEEVPRIQKLAVSMGPLPTRFSSWCRPAVESTLAARRSVQSSTRRPELAL